MVRWSLAVFSLLAWVTPLGAQPREEAVRFQYTAPPGCPDVASFTTRVRARTQRGRPAEAGELARTLSIEIAKDGNGFAGGLAFLDSDGVTVNRRLRGEQCEAVVNSLALITALALDASLSADEEAEPAAATGAQEKKPDEPPPPPGAVTPPPVTPPAVVASPPTVFAPDDSKHAPHAPPQHTATSALAGARIGVSAGYSSTFKTLAPRLAVLGELDWRRGFALRLSAHYDWRNLTVDGARRAKLRILGVETSACPWRFQRERLTLSPCATLDLGSLRAEGELGQQLTQPDSDTIVWAAVGAELRLAWEPDGPFWLELVGAGSAPLRATYQFWFRNPAQLVYGVPYFAGTGALSLGVRFW